MNIENVAAYQGTYSGASSYNQGDIVTYNSATYLSLVDSNSGNQPDTNPTSWVIIGNTAAAGKVTYAYSAGSSSVGLSLPAGTFIITAQTSNSGSGAIIGFSASGYSSVQAALGSVYMQGPGGGPNTYGNTFGIYTMNTAGTLTVSVTNGYTPVLATAVQIN